MIIVKNLTNYYIYNNKYNKTDKMGNCLYRRNQCITDNICVICKKNRNY